MRGRNGASAFQPHAWIGMTENNNERRLAKILKEPGASCRQKTVRAGLVEAYERILTAFAAKTSGMSGKNGNMFQSTPVTGRQQGLEEAASRTNEIIPLKGEASNPMKQKFNFSRGSPINHETKTYSIRSDGHGRWGIRSAALGADECKHARYRGRDGEPRSGSKARSRQ
jgi:hypothetical protein